jgi:hypothetical protein
MIDLFSRFVRKPLKEIDHDSYVMALKYVTSLFTDRKIIESPLQRWGFYVQATLHAKILAHHKAEEIREMFLLYRDQARMLCLARMPDVYNEANAKETEYLFLFGTAQTQGEINRINLELGEAYRQKQYEKAEELEREWSALRARLRSLATYNQLGNIDGGEMHALWEQLESDPEIKKARIDAAFYRALSMPCEVNAFEEYCRFFARIKNFMLQ